MKTSFQLVSEMNVAFGNPKGDLKNIDWGKVRNQCKNIGDEYLELLEALGADMEALETISQINQAMAFPWNPNLEEVRDALCDVQVFATGAQHLMGIDGDRDMQAVIDGVMTRFVKDEADLEATVKMHAAKGIKHVDTEGEYPNMILRSIIDQPDAPKGKFLKSASYKPTQFYSIE
jgi:hypothetical protein